MADEQVDVVVIGAGIVGASCAYQLALRGLRVLVLEKGAAPALGSSGRSAAGVRVQFTTPSNVLLSKLSLAAYRRFPEEHGLDVGYRPIGYLLLVPEARWADHLEAVALQHDLDVPVDVVTPAEAQRWVPFEEHGLAGATHGPIDGVVDPHLATHAFVTLARRAGAELRLSCAATGFRRDGDGWQVDTPDGALLAGQIVNAAGPWAGEVAQLAGLDVPVVPMRRHVYISAPRQDESILPLTIDLGTGFWLRSEGDRVLFGLSKQDQAPGFVEGMDEDWLEQVLVTGSERFPWLADLGVDLRSCWPGFYEVTPDHDPILGRHPDAEGWVDAAGFSGHGICHAPATGQVIAELVADGEASSVDLRAYRHGRFSPHRRGEANII